MVSLRIIATVGLAAVLARGQADTCADGSQPLSWQGATSDGSQDVETALRTVSVSGVSLTLGYVEELETQLVFLRFEHIEVPPGAEIHGAKVIYTVKQASFEQSRDFNVFVSALRMSKLFPADGNFQSFAGLVADGRTDANVTYVPDTNPPEMESESADLKSIVQEYVTYPGYQIDNAMTLLFGTPDAASTAQSRTYYSFESGGAAKGPRLSITYCLSGRSEASMSDDMDSVLTLEKGKVLDVFGASELRGKRESSEDWRFQQWHTAPTLGFIFASLAIGGMLVKLASRRTVGVVHRQAHGRDAWEDDASEARIE